MKRFTGSLILLVALYLGTYLWFRVTHVERWERDNQDYVIFPRSMVLYYFYRPLTYLDAKATGMRFHIGPHRL